MLFRQVGEAQAERDKPSHKPVPAFALTIAMCRNGCEDPA